ncbi:hypothetical protein [Saccharicrinis sp. GN24d3]|uniref:hypothetical protein n=1 Tax=Saccharicrinis sp. GN24d3 TaxID=3458416 RepID=UPI004034FCB0
MDIFEFETTARINLVWHDPPEEVMLDGNKGDLHYVFMNAYYKAIQAIKLKGKIVES